MENNNKYSGDNLAERLSSVIDDILSSGNSEDLSKKVSNTIEDAVNGVTQEIKNIYSGSATKVSNTIEDAVNGVAQGIKNIYSGSAKKQNTVKVNTSPVSKVKSVLFIASGGILTASGLASSLPLFLLVGKTPLFITLFLAASGIFLISRGVKVWGRSNRLALYRRYIEYLPAPEGGFKISDLAENTDIPEKQVGKDIKFFVSKDVFMGGNLSHDGTRFFASKDEYVKYLENERRKSDIIKQRAGENEYEKQTRIFFESMEDFIKDIRTSNNLIPDAEMSKKLDTTEALVSKIFARLREKPNLLPQARKLGEYYLPMTKKLVDAYAQLSDAEIETDNIKKSKYEIEKTLDTVNKAFYNLYAGLFDDEVIDINSDISVLNTMLSQEGLINDIPEKQRKWTE